VRIRPCTTPQTKLAATFFVLELALPEMISVSAAKLDLRMQNLPNLQPTAPGNGQGSQAAGLHERNMTGMTGR